MKNILIFLIGISGGITVGSAIAAFFTLLEFVPRIAQITETEDNIVFFEYSMVLGATIGSVLSYTNFNLGLNKFVVIIVGILSGTFLGLFTSALAEVLDVIPVLAKKFKIKHQLMFIIISLIIGKIVGSLFYFLVFLKF